MKESFSAYERPKDAASKGRIELGHIKILKEKTVTWKRGVDTPTHHKSHLARLK